MLQFAIVNLQLVKLSPGDIDLSDETGLTLIAQPSLTPQA
jgi:hypothetical protein